MKELDDTALSRQLNLQWNLEGKTQEHLLKGTVGPFGIQQLPDLWWAELILRYSRNELHLVHCLLEVTQRNVDLTHDGDDQADDVNAWCVL